VPLKRLKKHEVLKLREEVRQAVAFLGNPMRKEIHQAIGLDRFTAAQVRQQLESLCANGVVLAKDRKTNGTRAVFYSINKNPESAKPRKKAEAPRPVVRFMPSIRTPTGKTWRRSRDGDAVPPNSVVVITNNQGRIVSKLPYHVHDRELRVNRMIALLEMEAVKK